MKQLLIFHLLFFILLTTESTEAHSLARDGCQERCGEVRIPFPFGIGEHCALDKRYAVDCNASTPYLSAFGNVEVLNVSLEQQTITVNVSFDCQNRVLNSSQILLNTIDFGESGSPYLFSRLHNIFVVVGCGNAVVTDVEGTTVTGCSTTCRNDTFIDLKNCFGVRCCQEIVPYHLQRFTLNLTRLEGQGADGTCGSAFLVDKDSFLNGNFSLHSIARDRYSVPISLFWPLTRIYAQDVQTFKRPECTDLGFYLHDGTFEGYRKCECGMYEEGNPYLPNGCRKSEKCKDCERKGGVCDRMFGKDQDPRVPYDPTIPTTGNGWCDLPLDHGPSDGVVPVLSISLGILIPTAFVISIKALYKTIKKTVAKRRKEKFFKSNGGLLFKQQETSDAGLRDKTILFTSKELEIATDSYNENRILGRGGQGTVYKGMLADGRIIAVK